MPLTEETPILSSVANGVTTTFPYSFTVLQASDLVVTGTLSGSTVTYTYLVDYTLTGIGTSSGSVQFSVAPANGTIITRYRESEISRTTDYQENGDLAAAVLNKDLNRLWLVLQEMLLGARSAPSSLRVPAGETVPEFPSATARANTFPYFGSAGEPGCVALETIAPATLSAVLSPITLLNGGSTSHSDGSNTLTGSARWFYGNATPSSDDSALLIGRSLTGSYFSGAHAIRDETAYSPSGAGLLAYASFDSISTLSGAGTLNHLHSFQARPSYTGSVSLGQMAGLTMQANVSGTGTAAAVYGVRMDDSQGAGPVTTQAALFVNGTGLTRGASNYVIYSGHTGTPSYHGGKIQMGTAPQISAGGFSTFGALLGHDASGNLISNPNLTIINGTLTMANATTSKVVSSVAANLQLDSTVMVEALKPLRLPVYTVATLPSPASAYTYCRASVSDSSVALTAGIGAIVAGGGANKVPVFCDGANWRIG